MRLKNILTFVLCFGCFTCHVFGAYIDKPVMLHVNISNQHDSVGFNLVKDFPDFIYEQLKNGKIKLWDSPQKITSLNFEVIKALEKSSGTKFKDCSDVFLYEFWNCTRQSLSFTVSGFSFVYHDKEQLKPYGFIDAKEVFNLLSTNLIPSNPNATAKVSYWDAIASKRYHFTIVQYGRKKFTKNPLDALALKAKLFTKRRKLVPNIPWPDTKNIGYEMEDNYTIDYDVSLNLKKALEKYFNSNRDLVKLHGLKAFADTSEYKRYFTLTRLEVHETWEKKGSILLSYVDSLVVYVNNQRLTAFSNEEVRKIGITIKFKTIIDLLKEKSFDLSIFSINNVLIDPKNKEAYKNGIQGYSWTQLTEYVKYETANE